MLSFSSTPKKLISHHLDTLAVDSIQFNFNDKTIIPKCRAFDVEIKQIRKMIKPISQNGVDDQSILKSVQHLKPLIEQLNALKHKFYKHFTSSVQNTVPSLTWLHLEPSTKRFIFPTEPAASPEDKFVYEDGMMRWRLGLTREKRLYCDKPFINHCEIMAFLSQEPIETQAIILEFERVKVEIWILSINLRTPFLEACNIYQNYQSIKKMQAYYHSLKKE